MGDLPAIYFSDLSGPALQSVVEHMDARSLANLMLTGKAPAAALGGLVTNKLRRLREELHNQMLEAVEEVGEALTVCIEGTHFEYEQDENALEGFALELPSGVSLFSQQYFGSHITEQGSYRSAVKHVQLHSHCFIFMVDVAPVFSPDLGRMSVERADMRIYLAELDINAFNFAAEFNFPEHVAQHVVATAVLHASADGTRFQQPTIEVSNPGAPFAEQLRATWLQVWEQNPQFLDIPDE